MAGTGASLPTRANFGAVCQEAPQHIVVFVVDAGDLLDAKRTHLGARRKPPPSATGMLLFFGLITLRLAWRLRRQRGLRSALGIVLDTVVQFLTLLVCEYHRRLERDILIMVFIRVFGGCGHYRRADVVLALAKHDHFVGNQFGAIVFLSLLVFPASRL